MNDLIRKRDIDYISAPIAPVLKGENVHYEYVAFRKQIEDISPVPAIPISVIEQIKEDIELYLKNNYFGKAYRRDIQNIIDIALKEQDAEQEWLSHRKVRKHESEDDTVYSGKERTTKIF